MKGLFIPEITAEMFRNGCLESIETLMAEGEICDIDYQQPCEDAISRQAVKDILDARGVKAIMTFEHFKELLDDLPSVNPKPKTGHWIFDEILDKHYYCSECKSMGVDYWDYCPNCGARMESDGEE